MISSTFETIHHDRLFSIINIEIYYLNKKLISHIMSQHILTTLSDKRN